MPEQLRSLGLRRSSQPSTASSTTTATPADLGPPQTTSHTQGRVLHRVPIYCSIITVVQYSCFTSTCVVESPVSGRSVGGQTPEQTQDQAQPSVSAPPVSQAMPSTTGPKKGINACQYALPNNTYFLSAPRKRKLDTGTRVAEVAKRGQQLLKDALATIRGIPRSPKQRYELVEDSPPGSPQTTQSEDSATERATRRRRSVIPISSDSDEAESEEFEAAPDEAPEPPAKRLRLSDTPSTPTAASVPSPATSAPLVEVESTSTPPRAEPGPSTPAALLLSPPGMSPGKVRHVDLANKCRRSLHLSSADVTAIKPEATQSSRGPLPGWEYDPANIFPGLSRFLPGDHVPDQEEDDSDSEEIKWPTLDRMYVPNQRDPPVIRSGDKHYPLYKVSAREHGERLQRTHYPRHSTTNLDKNCPYPAQPLCRLSGKHAWDAGSQDLVDLAFPFTFPIEADSDWPGHFQCPQCIYKAPSMRYLTHHVVSRHANTRECRCLVPGCSTPVFSALQTDVLGCMCLLCCSQHMYFSHPAPVLEAARTLHAACGFYMAKKFRQMKPDRLQDAGYTFDAMTQFGQRLVYYTMPIMVVDTNRSQRKLRATPKIAGDQQLSDLMPLFWQRHVQHHAQDHPTSRMPPPYKLTASEKAFVRYVTALGFPAPFPAPRLFWAIKDPIVNPLTQLITAYELRPSAAGTLVEDKTGRVVTLTPDHFPQEALDLLHKNRRAALRRRLELLKSKKAYLTPSDTLPGEFRILHT